MARHFKNWLKAYCKHTEHSEAPLDFHFWTGVSTIAACLRRRVWKDELLFTWTPNFYIILVGPPGVVTKSTTLGLGFKLLYGIAEKQKLFFGPDSMTWQGLAKEFDKAVAYHTYKDPKTLEDKKVLMSPLTCSISELGTFLKPDDKGLVSFLTDVWDGRDRPFGHITSASGNIKVENAWLNIIGATTPMWLQNNFPPALLSEGIGSRIIFVFGDQKRKIVSYPSQLQRPVDFGQDEQRLMDDLVDICQMIGPYELTPEAYAWGHDWNLKHNASRGPSLASSRYAGYLARKQTHLHKLAMVIAAAKSSTLTITKDDLIEADAILTGTETSMIKVFESMGMVDEGKHIAELTTLVKAHQWISSKDLYRQCFNIMPEREYRQALRIAIEGELLEVEKRNGVLGVKPKQRTIN
jgi:hypothetical protein